MDLWKVFYILENCELFYTALFKQLEFLSQEAIDIEFGVPLTNLVYSLSQS